MRGGRGGGVKGAGLGGPGYGKAESCIFLFSIRFHPEITEHSNEPRWNLLLIVYWLRRPSIIYIFCSVLQHYSGHQT
jgi:hypothetical protein